MRGFRVQDWETCSTNALLFQFLTLELIKNKHLKPSNPLITHSWAFSLVTPSSPPGGCWSLSPGGRGAWHWLRSWSWSSAGTGKGWSAVSALVSASACCSQTSPAQHSEHLMARTVHSMWDVIRIPRYGIIPPLQKTIRNKCEDTNVDTKGTIR